MSTSVRYKGVEIATLENETKTLNTAGKWVEGDITLEDITGGGSSWTLIASHDFAVNTTSTSNTTVGTISCGSTAFTDKKVLYVRVRDKAGARLGYFYGSDAYFYNSTKANGGSATVSTAGRFVHRLSTSGQWGLYCSGTTTCYGVFGYSITSAGALQVRARYNSNYSLTINGTFTVEVYALDLPDGVMPYDAY